MKVYLSENKGKGFLSKNLFKQLLTGGSEDGDMADRRMGQQVVHIDTQLIKK